MCNFGVVKSNRWDVDIAGNAEAAGLLMAPNRFNPIHEDDIIAMLPGLLAAATVPATIVNWGGDETTSVDDGGIPTDNTRRLEMVGSTKVGWRDGMRRMVAALDSGEGRT